MARRGRRTVALGSEPAVSGDSGPEINDNISGDSSSGSADGGASAAIDPSTVGAEFDGSGGGNSDSNSGSDNAAVKPKRKYTRRNSGTASKGIPLDVMSAILLTGHSMLAGITRVEELALEESEASELARALNTVNSFYRVEVAEKTLAWINLAMVGGMIYGSRVVAIRARVAASRGRREPDLRRASPMQAPVAEPPSPMADFDRGGEINDVPGFDVDVAEPPDTFVPGFGEVKLN